MSYIPISSNMSKKEIEEICNKLKRVFSPNDFIFVEYHTKRSKRILVLTWAELCT